MSGATNDANPDLGGWMQVRSGKAYHFERPQPGAILLSDIAHHLGNICRFGGAVSDFYSVAEHSVLVSYCVPKEHAFSALMHDATEAYVGDMARPLKHAVGGQYGHFEYIAWLHICRKFDLPVHLHPSVKMADNAVLITERNELMLKPPIEWTWARGLAPAPVVINCFPPRQARAVFLERFKELTS